MISFSARGTEAFSNSRLIIVLVGIADIPSRGIGTFPRQIGQLMCLLLDGRALMMSSKQPLQTLWAQPGRHLGSLKSSKQTGQDNSSSTASLNTQDDIDNIVLSSFSRVNNGETLIVA